jgi:hypothetical protein
MLNFFKKDLPLTYIFLPYEVTGIEPSSHVVTMDLNLDEMNLDEVPGKDALLEPEEG